jgi:hypothetical protein
VPVFQEFYQKASLIHWWAVRVMKSYEIISYTVCFKHGYCNSLPDFSKKAVDTKMNVGAVAFVYSP